MMGEERVPVKNMPLEALLSLAATNVLHNTKIQVETIARFCHRFTVQAGQASAAEASTGRDLGGPAPPAEAAEAGGPAQDTSPLPHVEAREKFYRWKPHEVEVGHMGCSRVLTLGTCQGKVWVSKHEVICHACRRALAPHVSSISQDLAQVYYVALPQCSTAVRQTSRLMPAARRPSCSCPLHAPWTAFLTALQVLLDVMRDVDPNQNLPVRKAVQALGALLGRSEYVSYVSLLRGCCYIAVCGLALGVQPQL